MELNLFWIISFSVMFSYLLRYIIYFKIKNVYNNFIKLINFFFIITIYTLIYIYIN